MKAKGYVCSMYGMSLVDFHVGASSPSFVSNMRRLLQVRAAKHYTHGMKSGMISKSRMFRVGLPPIDGGEWNSRVFKKKHAETDLLDTAIFLLVDWSGSMAGDKACCAAKASALCNEAFGRVLHVPLQIVAFSSSGPVPSLGIVKEFNESVSADQVAERFYSFLPKMSGNNDADSLLWAYNEILKRKEKRKVIIILSDGSPADGLGDPVYGLKTVTNEIVSRGKVDLYGIGIMDTNVERFYPKHKVINSINELEPALVEVMGRALS